MLLCTIVLIKVYLVKVKIMLKFQRFIIHSPLSHIESLFFFFNIHFCFLNDLFNIFVFNLLHLLFVHFLYFSVHFFDFHHLNKDKILIFSIFVTCLSKLALIGRSTWITLITIFLVLKLLSQHYRGHFFLIIWILIIICWRWGLDWMVFSCIRRIKRGDFLISLTITCFLGKHLLINLIETIYCSMELFVCLSFMRE